MPAELRSDIAAALAALGSQPLAKAAAELFSALGYGSERRLELPSLRAFFSEFDVDRRATTAFPETASPAAGDSVLVQQLTSEEIAANSAGQFSFPRREKGKRLGNGTCEKWKREALASFPARLWSGRLLFLPSADTIFPPLNFQPARCLGPFCQL